VCSKGKESKGEGEGEGEGLGGLGGEAATAAATHPRDDACDRGRPVHERKPMPGVRKQRQGVKEPSAQARAQARAGKPEHERTHR
jgi:hypothetical protein